MFRNSDNLRQAFKKIPHWQALLEQPQHLGIDESKFSKVFIPHKNHPLILRKMWALFSAYRRNIHFEEQFNTILSPRPWHDGSRSHPQHWIWQQGHLTNRNDGDPEFMYLHFMNWKSNRWLPKALRDKPSAWMECDDIIKLTDLNIITTDGFQNTPTGFSVIDQY